MAVHEDLAQLRARVGGEAFLDPATLRGVLDDYLDETAATPGELNLLVDAVRLGAVAALVEMIQHGATPTAAIEDAGSRLARERGTEDVAGSAWACATIGYALGHIPEAEVTTRRRPLTPPAGMPTVSGTPTTDPADNPGASPVQAHAAHTQAPPPAAATQPASSHREPKQSPRSRRGVLVGSAAALVIVALLVALVLTTTGDDSDPSSDKAAGKEQTQGQNQRDEPDPPDDIGEGGGAEPAASGRDMADVVSELEHITSITKTVTVTEGNDPNDLIGRPNGYEAAFVFHDSRADCVDGLGVACGATLEVFPDEASARSRQAYIETLQRNAPILGSDYVYRDGRYLLRVSGDLVPSAAVEYEKAFTP